MQLQPPGLHASVCRDSDRAAHEVAIGGHGDLAGGRLGTEPGEHQNRAPLTDDYAGTGCKAASHVHAADKLRGSLGLRQLQRACVRIPTSDIQPNRAINGKQRIAEIILSVDGNGAYITSVDGIRGWRRDNWWRDSWRRDNW